MSRSLDNDCTIQDLAFQVLNPFGANNFNIRPLARIMSFMTWPSKTWTQVNMIVKTWQPPQFWNLTFLLRPWQYPMSWHVTFFGNSMPPSLGNDCTRYSRLGFSKSWNFLGQRISTFDPCQEYVFHDLVFQDVTTSEHDCQDLAATGLKSYIFLCYNFATPCPQVLLGHFDGGCCDASPFGRCCKAGVSRFQNGWPCRAWRCIW